MRLTNSHSPTCSLAYSLTSLVLHSLAQKGTADGGIGMLTPVDEGVYRRLSYLQPLLSHAMEHHCALNPRDFRQPRVKESKHDNLPHMHKVGGSLV